MEGGGDTRLKEVEVEEVLPVISELPCLVEAQLVTG